MVKEAVKKQDGNISHQQIIKDIKSKHGDVNVGTIRAGIITCTVNHPSRTHYITKKESREASGEKDFLFKTKRGEVTKYNRKKHGDYGILLEGEKLWVTKDGEKIAPYTPDVQEYYSKILRKKSQLIFYGPPGTGKTYNAVQLAKNFIQDKSDKPLKLRSAIIKILKDADKPLHYTAITKKIKSQKLVQPQKKVSDTSVKAELNREDDENDPDFIETDNTYDLNPDKNNPEILNDSLSLNKNEKQFICSVTFHQSYSYEDFIEGIRPDTTKNQISYILEDGIFKQFVEKAEKDKEHDYVLIIDEINRGNISKIFGELITLVEKDKRGSHSLQLAYSKSRFTVPKNLFIIGTMNTADRSLVQIDVALRRRFAFIELMPKPELLKDKEIDKVSLQDLLTGINQKIINAGEREKQIGHSYFMDVETQDDLEFAFTHEIVPLLQDYFFDDYKKLEDILKKDFTSSKSAITQYEWKMADIKKLLEKPT